MSFLFRCCPFLFGCCCPDEESDDNGAPLLGTLGTRYEHVEEIEGEPTDKKWYHGKISDNEAEYRLKVGSDGVDGSYLVYDCPSTRGRYWLIVMHKNSVLRWKITRTRDGMFVLGEVHASGAVKYPTIRELIHAHRGITGKPIKLENGGTITLSKSYVYKVDD